VVAQGILSRLVAEVADEQAPAHLE
jgi:hypothetical protein